MKNVIKITALVLSLVLLSAMVISAQEHNNMNKTDKAMDAKKIDKNGDGVVYECPMKCEEASDKEGECSKCGMKLAEISVNDTNKEMKCEGKEKSGCCEKEMKNDKFQMMEKQGKKIDHSKMNKSIVRDGEINVSAIDENKDGKVFQCPMCADQISDEYGKCEKCGMGLKEVTIKDAKNNLTDHQNKTK